MADVAIAGAVATGGVAVAVAPPGAPAELGGIVGGFPSSDRPSSTAVGPDGGADVALGRAVSGAAGASAGATAAGGALGAGVAAGEGAALGAGLAAGEGAAPGPGMAVGVGAA